MDTHRRVTRSTSNTRRNPDETEGSFWGRMIDPTVIERGQAEAIRAARRAASDDPSALLSTTQDEQLSQPADNNQRSLMDEDIPTNLLEDKIPFTSNLTNYNEQSLRMVNTMRTAFMDNSPSTTERVTTPVGMDITGIDGPLDPAFSRPSLQPEDPDLDAQPTKGPREVGNATNDLLDQYMDENYGDVLRTSLLNPNSYLLLPSVKKSPQQVQPRLMAMDWFVPDGSNSRDSGDKNCGLSFTWRRYRRYDTDSTPLDVTLPDNKVLGGHRHGRVVWVDHKPMAPYWTLLFDATVCNK